MPFNYLNQFAKSIIALTHKLSNHNSMKSKIFLFIGMIFIMTSCIKSLKYDEGRFPVTPVNMTEFNTDSNDYNSAMPNTLLDVFPLLFSSNRYGAHYDVVKEYVEINFNRENGELRLSNSLSESLTLTESYGVLGRVPTLINTDANELGPYIMEYYPAAYDKYDGLFRVLYANDQTGNLDIYFTSNIDNRNNFSTPQPVSFLNTEFNDAYPSFNDENDVLYFTSDRGGDFDIYSVAVNGDIDQVLSGADQGEIEKETVLSSDYEDKCPYVQGDMMVFTSDRPGGLGGFDLYYSIRTENTWSNPINFGPAINSEKDEYRPIIARFNFYSNNLMIFSSNRDGGKGGFDLYYVGINK